jgi:hypothetical protein
VRSSCSVVNFPCNATTSKSFKFFYSLGYLLCTSSFAGLRYTTPAIKGDRDSLVEKQGTSRRSTKENKCGERRSVESESLVEERLASERQGRGKR